MILFFSVILTFLNFLVISGLRKILSRPMKYPPLRNFNRVSIVCSSRNEGKKLARLVNSLREQDLPEFECIITDDYSTDRSVEEITPGAKENEFFILNNGPRGKKYGLTAAIGKSTTGAILITDADCSPLKGWASACLKKLNEGYDIIFGIAPYYINGTLAGRISAFENLKSFILSLSALARNLPYSAAARSFGFTKEAFDKISGYRHTMEIPFGDDGLLIREAVKNNLKIGAVTDQNSFVFSEPKSSLKEYIYQRRRHTRTSFYYSRKIQFILALWHILNLIPFLMLLLLPLNYLFFIPLLLKMICDILICLLYQKNFGYRFSIFEIFYLNLIYEFFIVFHFFSAAFGKINWKQRL